MLTQGVRLMASHIRLMPRLSGWCRLTKLEFVELPHDAIIGRFEFEELIPSSRYRIRKPSVVRAIEPIGVMRDRSVDGDKHPVDAEIIRCHKLPTERNRTTTRVPVVAMARQQGVWYRLNPVDGVNHPALPLGFDDCIIFVSSSKF